MFVTLQDMLYCGTLMSGKSIKIYSSSEGVDAPDKVSVNTSGYEDWKNAFWNMASKLRDLGILCDVTLSVGSSPGDIKMFQVSRCTGIPFYIFMDYVLLLLIVPPCCFSVNQ